MSLKPSRKPRDRRVKAKLPLRAGGRSGVMRDVSASGMLLETDAAYHVGKTMAIALNLDTPWGKVIINCHGRIVRLDKHDHRIGVAVEFVDSAPESIPRKRRAAKK
jgi:hypothetical protein